VNTGEFSSNLPNFHEMKVLQFTIPVSREKTFIVQRDVLPHFYPHLHRHNEIQLVWVIKGEGTLVAENNMHAFRSNDIFWLSANLPHLFKSDPSYFQPKSKKKITSLNVFFDPEGSLASLFSLPELKNIKTFIGQHGSGFRVPSAQAPEVSSFMNRLYTAKGVDQFMIFIELLKSIAQCRQPEPLSQDKPLHSYSEHEGIRIGTIYNFVMHNYDKPIKLEDVAKQAHMTRQAFCRYFKKHTLHTFLSFLNQVRINEACKKLTDASYDSIATVAYNCGFNSIANFNRVFRSTTGKSPSEYVESYFQSVES
jgi:AraC-like DNA-binding protein/quercetin dioxygenase-like cupin family protein